MKGTRVPVVEPLEGKALLSRAAIALPVAPPIVAPMNQGLQITLTTDHMVYHKGQPVEMTLTETNRSNHTINVELGPSIDGFFITKNGKEVWASNTGPQPDFVLEEPLAPGQSISLSATWNGQSNIGAPSSPTGLLFVHSQVPNSPTAVIWIERS